MQKTALKSCLSLIIVLTSSCGATQEQNPRSQEEPKGQQDPKQPDNTPKAFDAMLQVQEQGSGTIGIIYKLRMLPDPDHKNKHSYIDPNSKISLKYGTKYSASLIFANTPFSANNISETDTHIIVNNSSANLLSPHSPATGLLSDRLNSVSFKFSVHEELTDLLKEDAKSPLHLFVACHEKGNDHPVFTVAIPMKFED